MTEHNAVPVANGHCQSNSSTPLLKQLLQSNLLSCTVETTRSKTHEKSDPILSDLGTLAINSVNRIISAQFVQKKNKQNLTIAPVAAELFETHLFNRVTII